MFSRVKYNKVLVIHIFIDGFYGLDNKITIGIKYFGSFKLIFLPYYWGKFMNF